MTFFPSKALAEIAQRSGSLSRTPHRSESCNSFFSGEEKQPPGIFSGGFGAFFQRSKSRRDDGPGRVFGWVIQAFQSKQILAFLLLPLLTCLLVWGLLSRSGEQSGQWSAERQPWGGGIVVESSLSSQLSQSSLLLSQASHSSSDLATGDRVRSDGDNESSSRVALSTEGPSAAATSLEQEDQEGVVEAVDEGRGDGDAGSLRSKGSENGAGSEESESSGDSPGLTSRAEPSGDAESSASAEPSGNAESSASVEGEREKGDVVDHKSYAEAAGGSDAGTEISLDGGEEVKSGAGETQVREEEKEGKGSGDGSDGGSHQEVEAAEAAGGSGAGTEISLDGGEEVKSGAGETQVGEEEKEEKGKEGKEGAGNAGGSDDSSHQEGQDENAGMVQGERRDGDGEGKKEAERGAEAKVKEKEEKKGKKGKEKGKSKEKGKGKKGKKKGKKRHGGEEVTLDIPADCDLYHGTWQPDTDPPLYTNSSCEAISQHQNCQGNGRPDSGYERWRWRPGGREECGALPRFDAREFMSVMRGKSVLFVGDSVARNHMESLICLLSQVEKPHLRGSKSMLRMVFPRNKLSVARIWSAWLVQESPLPAPSTLPNAPKTLPRLHLDRTGEGWMKAAGGGGAAGGGTGGYDVVVLCTGHWFVKPALFVVGGRVVGSQGGWWEANHGAMEGAAVGKGGEGSGDGGGGGEVGAGAEGSGSKLVQGEIQKQPAVQWRRLEGSESSDSSRTDLANMQPPLNNTAAFSVAIRTVFQDVAAAVRTNPNQLFVFRTYSPDHYEGGQWNTGGSCAGLAEPRGPDYTYSNPFGNTIYNEQRAAYSEAVSGLGESEKQGFSLMDIMPSAGVRVDGHPGPYRGVNSTRELESYKEKNKGLEGKFPPPQDCLHWCLPGPVDSWNVFLFQLIKRHRVVRMQSRTR